MDRGETGAGRSGATHIDLLPLADVAHQPGQPQQAHQAQQLSQPQDAQRPTGVQDLEALSEVLKRRKLKPGYGHSGARLGSGAPPFTALPNQSLGCGVFNAVGTETRGWDGAVNDFFIQLFLFG